MGIHILSSCGEPARSVTCNPLPNPDPDNFTITRAISVRSWVIIMAVYPDATNYEGQKVMVYRNTTIKAVKAQKRLDPHFCDHPGHLSPFARFEPTEAGWAAAMALAMLFSV
jgi:hypothetical protein